MMAAEKIVLAEHLPFHVVGRSEMHAGCSRARQSQNRGGMDSRLTANVGSVVALKRFQIRRPVILLPHCGGLVQPRPDAESPAVLVEEDPLSLHHGEPAARA